MKPRASLHDGHLRAEGAEDVAHLGGDEATTDDDQRRRYPLDPHDGVGGVVLDGAEPGDRRYDRARSGGDDDLLCAQVLPGHLKHLRRDETGGRGVDIDAAAPPVLDRPVMDRVDPAEDPLPDRRPIDPVEGRVHAETLRLHHRPGDIGGDDEHLRRDAPSIEAGTPEAVGLDDRRPQPVQLRAEEHVAASRPDDDQIIGTHRPSSMPHGAAQPLAQRPLGR